MVTLFSRFNFSALAGQTSQVFAAQPRRNL
jgi:hypothetical protein